MMLGRVFCMTKRTHSKVVKISSRIQWMKCFWVPLLIMNTAPLTKCANQLAVKSLMATEGCFKVPYTKTPEMAMATKTRMSFLQMWMSYTTTFMTKAHKSSTKMAQDNLRCHLRSLDHLRLKAPEFAYQKQIVKLSEAKKSHQKKEEGKTTELVEEEEQKDQALKLLHSFSF